MMKGQGMMGMGGGMGMGKGMPGMMPGGKNAPHGTGDAPKGSTRHTDPVVDAEAALKRLRQDPSDKGAADELERALKALKEREKSRPPAEEVIKGK
jgi:hypothetical protein